MEGVLQDALKTGGVTLPERCSLVFTQEQEVLMHHLTLQFQCPAIIFASLIKTPNRLKGPGHRNVQRI